MMKTGLGEYIYIYIIVMYHHTLLNYLVGDGADKVTELWVGWCSWRLRVGKCRAY